MMSKLGVALVGCGEISRKYVSTLLPAEQVELVGAFDILPERTQQAAESFEGKAYDSMDALLADDAVDAVVNITIEREHAAVTRRCLEAGKHVYSEKPLALRYDEATGLLDLAAEKGVRLAAAPITILGEAEQTAWKLIREGRLGDVRFVYVDMNWGRIESWHPTPAPFYQVGPLLNVGIYALTTLTTIFGPVRRVTGFGRVAYPDRRTRDGEPFAVTAPDLFIAIVELANGTIGRLTTNFYVSFNSAKQRGAEFHGDLGSLYVFNPWLDFNSTVEFAPPGQPYEPVPLVGTPYEGFEISRGVIDLAGAIAEGRPHRASAEQAAHLVEVFDALTTSSEEGRAVEVTSEFPVPAPMDWAT
jgi:predicted dehydrogenase